MTQSYRHLVWLPCRFQLLCVYFIVASIFIFLILVKLSILSCLVDSLISSFVKCQFIFRTFLFGCLLSLDWLELNLCIYLISRSIYICLCVCVQHISSLLTIFTENTYSNSVDCLANCLRVSFVEHMVLILAQVYLLFPSWLQLVISM